MRYERGDYWPSVDVDGNYYTKRATFLKDLDWDVMLSVDFPLFRGGITSSLVNEAKSAYRQSLLEVQSQERYVDYQVRRLYDELVLMDQQVQALADAADAAEKSYRTLLKEYKLGLVTNLDVLQTLDFFLTQQHAHDVARISAKRLYIQLQVATETL